MFDYGIAQDLLLAFWRVGSFVVLRATDHALTGREIRVTALVIDKAKTLVEVLQAFDRLSTKTSAGSECQSPSLFVCKPCKIFHEARTIALTLIGYHNLIQRDVIACLG